jgi:hypothetical protein
MEEDRNIIEEIESACGFTEDEARAFYHLSLVEELFDLIFYGRSGYNPCLRLVYISHFQSPIGFLAVKVVERDCPE